MHTLMKLLPIMIVTVFLGSVDSHAATNEQALDSWPDWLKEAMGKETRRPKFRKIEAPDGSFVSKLPGKHDAPSAFDGGWYFSSDIKAGSPLECYIWNESLDLASLTSYLANTSIESLAETHGTVSERTVFHTDAGEIAGVPYLALEWFYLIQGDEQALAAFTKVRAAVKGDIAFACSHSYLGYRETFEKAFAEFVSNAVYEKTSPTPYYEEITKVDMGEFGTGVAHTQYTVDEAGDLKMYLLDASITAVDSSTIITSDSYTISFSQPDGTLINAHSIGVENGEVTSQLSLERGENDMWVSSGTLQGKEISTEIDGTLRPASELEQIALAKDLFAGEETSASALIWAAEVDPTRFIETTITRDDADVARQAILTLGPLSITGRFDDHGNMRDAEMAIGPVSVEMHRLWSNGSLDR